MINGWPRSRLVWKPAPLLLLLLPGMLLWVKTSSYGDEGEAERGDARIESRDSLPTEGVLPAFYPRPASSPQQNDAEITLVEEGWTEDLFVNGSTLIPGYFYRVYENSRYPCGTQGYHRFMVLDHGRDPSTQKHLFAKFLGGGVGFFYEDLDGNRIYYTKPTSVGLLQQSLNHNWMFRTSVSEEHANGVTKRFRENEHFRILVPSYCSHDFYHGRDECHALDGFCRYGYLAATEALEYVFDHFNTDKVITYGGSAGAAGFYVGLNQEKVVGMVMDSQAIDVSAISDACAQGTNVFGSDERTPCRCPKITEDTGPICMDILVERIGFTKGEDEPYHSVERGEVGKPIYLVWNEKDASNNAELQYINLHNAIEQYNPGGRSVARMVCIDDPKANPGPKCTLHVPSAHDYPDTLALVEEIYRWSLILVGDLGVGQIFLPAIWK